jgi:hypothetical protein
MNGLFPIIRRKRRPLSVPDGHHAPDGSPAVNPLALKPDRLPPVAVVPLVAAVPESAPESVPDGPIKKPKKSRDAAPKN